MTLNHNDGNIEITDEPAEEIQVSKTKHIQARMSQRAIKQDLLDIALQFGIQQGDKCILTTKGARELIAELDRFKRDTQKIVDKGGLVVIGTEDNLITTYRLDSYKRQAS